MSQRRKPFLTCVLSALLLWGFVLSGSEVHKEIPHARKCVHSSHVEPELEKMVRAVESIPMETHRAANSHFNPYSTRTLLEEPEPQPIRIHVEYQLDNLPPESVAFVKTDLMPAVKAMFQRSISIKKPVRGRFYLPYTCVSLFKGYPGYCHQVGDTCGTATHNKNFFGPGRTCVQPFDDECTEIPPGTGVPDADFVLYVTAKSDAGCRSSSETVASAGFCTSDIDNWYGLYNRPLAGVANFCPDNLYSDEDMFGYMLDTAVHEVLHALVFSKQLFEKFIDHNELPRSNQLVRQGDSLLIETPAVVKAARTMLGCNTVEGAPLENEGGYGTAESHWERRYFLGEIMIGSSSASSRVMMSNLTLALAEDSGWYLPHYGSSGVLAAIEHRGCAFVDQDCRNYHKSLENTFCWDTRDPSQQPPVCTPDHMAIGYCNAHMALMGECSVVQPYKNTRCTNPDDYKPTEHVDLGMRHQMGARCYPVDSYKISRTENFYTVYRSDLGAACFDTVCKEDELYIRIPATNRFPSKDIRCPTGEFVDLTDHGLGYDEGTIGPCPDNDLICESHGCKDDCNSNGICFKGQCYCNIGYVLPYCRDLSCPHHPCEPGSTCQEALGVCYPDAFSPRTPPPIPKATTIFEGISDTPDFSNISRLPTWVPRPSISLPTVGTAEVGQQTEPSPSPEEPREPVPFSEPRKPVVPLPSSSPLIEELPPGPSPDPYTVPAYAAAEGTDGRVIAVGYLSKCMLYEDSRGDLVVRPETVRKYTKEYGEWSLDPFPKENQLVVDPSFGSSCVDLFTGIRPIWRLRGFETVRTLSGISTLAALAPSAQNRMTNASNAQDSEQKYSSYEMEEAILTSLGLKDKYILQRDFVMETWATDDMEAARAATFNAMIYNTVVQVSCFVDATEHISYRTADFTVQILAGLLEGGLPLSKLIYADTVYLLVDRITTSETNGRNAYLLSETIANLNKIGYDKLEKHMGVELLDAISRMNYVAQTQLCWLAADLQTGRMSWPVYYDETTKHKLNFMMENADIPDIDAVMRREVDNAKNDLHLGLPFIDTQWKEAIVVGAMIVSIIIISVFIYRWVCMPRE